MYIYIYTYKFLYNSNPSNKAEDVVNSSTKYILAVMLD